MSWPFRSCNSDYAASKYFDYHLLNHQAQEMVRREEAEAFKRCASENQKEGCTWHESLAYRNVEKLENARHVYDAALAAKAAAEQALKNCSEQQKQQARQSGTNPQSY